MGLCEYAAGFHRTDHAMMIVYSGHLPGVFHKDRFFHRGTDLKRNALGLIPHQRHCILDALAGTGPAAHAFFVDHVILSVYDFQGMELAERNAIATANAQIFVYLGDVTG